MADVPNQTLNVRDPGLGVVPEAADSFVFLGTSSKGTANVLRGYNSPGDVVDTLGQGPLAEALCTYLAIAGGPAIGLKIDHTGNEGSVSMGTVVRAGSSDGTVAIAASSTDPDGPYDRYEDGEIEILTSGNLGAAEFRYTLDGVNYSPAIIVPAGGVYTIPNTGLDITFAADTSDPAFDDGDKFPFATTANHYDTSALSDAVAAAEAATDEFAVLVLTGREASTADGATLFAALDTHMTSLANAYKFAGAIMDAGVPETTGSPAVTDYATVKTNWVNAISADSRVAACFGGLRHVSQKPFVGWGNPHVSLVADVAAHAGAILLSSHLGRVADGPLTGVTSIDYDEERDAEGMSAAGFITTRTWQGSGGFFVNKGNLRSPVGSDFTNWPRRRIMDVALDIVQKSLQPFMNTKIRVKTDGTGQIEELAALRIENVVNNALAETLLSPTDAEGNQGHVPDVRYSIDRTNNVLTTGRVIGTVGIVPDPYAEEITTTLGFTAQV